MLCCRRLVADSPARPRDLAIDLLRGYFMSVVVVDHLRFRENLLYALTGHMQLWVTAAEGFVLVSGFLVGRRRGGEARRFGLAGPARLLLRRSLILALWNVLVTLVLGA